MDGARILVVDDEPDMLENCERILSRAGYECVALSDPLRFRDVLGEANPDAVLMDLRMPSADGMTLLTVAQSDDDTLPVIMMTAYATVASAVDAIREGAFDYLTKPFKSDQLLVIVERAVRHGQLLRENRALRRIVAEESGDTKLIGSHSSIAKLLSRVERVAQTDANVLILGESGTGKEMIARQVHASSDRRDRPFIPVDCASLPEGLMESELFGHEKGAFTGAERLKRGLVEKANGGTMFLDEITVLALGLQAKLLRLLEQRQIRRLGGSDLMNVDIRVVAATNIDLEQAVAQGSFREDLYFRLNVVPIEVPPLRDRGEDIVLLARHFLAHFSHVQGRDPPRVSPMVWAALARHEWPGNVRELRNLIERVVVLDEDGKVSLSDLPEALRPMVPMVEEDDTGALPAYEAARDSAVRAFRAAYLERLLDSNDGNISQAARQAGVSRRTLHRWLADQADSAEVTG